MNPEFRRNLWLELTPRRVVFMVAILALITLLPVRLLEVSSPDWRPLGWVHAFAVIAITFVVIYLISVAAPAGIAPFIYFQF